MDYFSARIRLNGSVMNEVRKDCLSAPEVIIMQYLHGADSVLDIVKVDPPDLPVAFTHDAERERLIAEYERALRRQQISFIQIFGPSHVALPVSVPGYTEPDEVDEPTEVSGAHRPRGQKSGREKLTLAAHEINKAAASPDAVSVMD